MLIVVLALTAFTQVYAMYKHPKPEHRPEDYSADIWPLWFVAMAFYHNRRFGLLFLLGLVLEVVLRVGLAI